MQEIRDTLHHAITHAFSPDDPSRAFPPVHLTQEDFDGLARAVVDHQQQHNAAYARYLNALPPFDSPHSAHPIPTSAFKRATLTTFDPEEAVVCFRSSGTTEHDRGRHHLRDLSLARAAILPPFVRFMLPDRPRIHMLILAPPFAQAADSSLCFMFDELLTHCGTPESTHLVTHDIDVAAFHTHINHAIEHNEPVFLLGPSFAYVHLLDALGDTFRPLPEGSRLLETGGFKGKSRVVPRGELHAAIQRALDIPTPMIAGEYGMSELSSQLYEPTIRHHLAGLEPRRRYVAPPWCAPRVLHLDTLEPLPLGERGLVAFFDLANLESVASILTGDLGRLHPEPDAPHGVTLELLGRSPAATPKGCSIAIDSLLSGDEDAPWTR